MRRHIAHLIDDNYARQIRLPKDGRDFRTPELMTAGEHIVERVIAQRAWLAEQQRLRATGVKVLRFGGAAK